MQGLDEKVRGHTTSKEASTHGNMVRGVHSLSGVSLRDLSKVTIIEIYSK